MTLQYSTPVVYPTQLGLVTPTLQPRGPGRDVPVSEQVAGVIGGFQGLFCEKPQG